MEKQIQPTPQYPQPVSVPEPLEPAIPVKQVKKKSRWWIWLIIAFIILMSILIIF